MVTSYWARRSHRLGLALCISLFVAIALVSMTWTGSYAQSSQVTQARITQILNGNQVYIQNRQAAVNAIANRGQRIHTERSRAELRLNNGAVGRLGRNTALVVGRDCVRVRRGQLLVNGASRGCTNQMVLGVRGTTYVLEVDEADNATVTVLEGQVDLILGSSDSANTSASASTSRLKHPGDGPAPLPVIPLSAGVRVTVDAAGQIQNLQALSQPEFTALLTGPLMANYPQPLPGQAQL
ncbi:MAG: FecR domain-containing protein, partial [Cyanobacteria bacterium P01_C01_bin.120]